MDKGHDLDEAGDAILAALHGRGWRRKVDGQGRLGAQLLARGLLEQHLYLMARAKAGRARRGG